MATYREVKSGKINDSLTWIIENNPAMIIHRVRVNEFGSVMAEGSLLECEACVAGVLDGLKWQGPYPDSPLYVRGD